MSLNRRVSLGLLLFILGVFPAEGAAPMPAVVTIESTNGIVLSFPTDAILEEATEVDGLWLTVPGAANPYSVPLSLESRKFFRARMPGNSIRSETNPANGHIYHLIAGSTGQQGVSWTEAETTANALGGHLATVNDAAENSWITSTFPEASYFWIGLGDVDTEGVFAWSSRQPVSFLNWFPGEPNDTSGVEDYVLIYNFDSGFRQWNDNANTREFGSFPIYGVAEIDPFTLAPEGGNYSTRFQRAVWASNRDGSYEIWMLDLAQTNFVQLTTNSVPTVNQHPVFTHDGSRIVFERDEDLYIMDVNGANVQRLTFDGHSSHPWASFDGRIYFTRMVSGVHTLWQMELDSTNSPEQLTQPDAERFHGNLRCDGKLLLYTLSPLGTSTPTAIRILNLQSGEDKALYSPGWPVSAAIWHPDGHKVILAEDHDGDGAYRLVEVGYPGGAVLNDTLTTDAASHTIPYYSYPDGQDIDWVLQPDAGRSRDIWRMSSDGSNQENLSRHPLEDTKIVGYPTGTDSEGRCIRPPVGCNPTPPPCDLLLPAGPREDAEDLGGEFQRRDLLAGGLDDVRFPDFQTFTETRLQEALGLPDIEPSLRDAASRLLELWLNDPTPGRRDEIAYVFVNSYLNDYPAITGPMTSTNDVYFAGTALVLISTVPPELGSSAIVHFDVAGTSTQVTADNAGLYTIVLEVPTNSTETPISTYAIAGDGSRQTPVSHLRAMPYPAPSFGFALPRNLATEAAPATMGGVRPANGIISVQPNPCTCIECGGGTALGIFSPAAFNSSYATVDHGVELVTSRLLHTFDIASFSTRRHGFSFQLYHASRAAYAGSFGQAVSHSFNMGIVQRSETLAELWTPNLRVFEIYSEDGVNWTLPDGFFATLTLNTTLRRWELTHFSGTTLSFYQAPLGVPANLISWRDPNGNATSLQYDTLGRLVGVRTDLDQPQSLAYDAETGRIAAFTDHLGRETEFAHDAQGRLVEIHSPPTEFVKIEPGQEITDEDFAEFVTNEQQITRLEYSENFPDHIYYVTDPRGAIPAQNYYDDQGRVQTRVINGGEVLFEYQSFESPGLSSRQGISRHGRIGLHGPPPVAPLDPGNRFVWVTDREGNLAGYELHGPNGGPGGGGAFGLRRKIEFTESGLGRTALRPDEPASWEYRLLHDCNCLAPIVVTEPFSSTVLTNLMFDQFQIPTNWSRTVYTYNGYRQVTTNLFTDGTNNIMTASTYQPSGFGQNGQYSRLLAQTDPRLHHDDPLYPGRSNFVHSYEYDGLGNRVRHTAPTVTNGVPAAQMISEAWTHNEHGQPLSHTDPNGNLTVYTYHHGASIGGNINTRGVFGGYLANVTRGATGSSNEVVNLTERMEINALGMVTRRTDPKGFATDYGFNTLGQMIGQLDPWVTLRNGSTVRYATTNAYDGAGNLVLSRRSNIDVHGAFDLDNPWIDRTLSYDAVNNLLSERVEVDGDDASDLITRYAYTRNDDLAVTEKPEGNRTFQVYDERDLPFRTFYGIEPGPTIKANYPTPKTATDLGGIPFVGYTQTDYDARRNATHSQDGRGYRTLRLFDFRNRQIALADPNGNGWIREYDAASLVVTEAAGAVDATGTLSQMLRRTYHRYDEAGREYQTVHDIDLATDESLIVDPTGADTSRFRTRFDAGSRTEASVDANGNATSVVYDAANRRITVIDALNNSVATVYDANSNVTELRETELPGPGVTGSSQTYLTQLDYDELNRRTTNHIRGLLDANDNLSFDHRSIVSYNSRGNAVLMQDPEGRFALHTFDDQSRLVRMQRYDIDPTDAATEELQRVEFRFDRNSRKTNDIAYSNVADPGSAQITRYAYDYADRRIREVYPDSDDPIDGSDNGTDGEYDRIEVALDANGNPEFVKEQREVQFVNTFDPGNRLSDQLVIASPSVPGTTQQAFGYDALNRMTNAANNYAQVGREYDALSRQTAEIQSIRLDGSGFVNGWEQPVRVACAFDSQSNNTGCEVTDGVNTNLTVWRAFDALNRVDTIAAAYFNTNRPIADYNYFGPGRIHTKTLGNGVRLTNTYDAKRRIQAMNWSDPVDLLVGLEYDYSAADNVLFERFLHDGGHYDHFGYNKRDELIHVEYRSPDPSPPATWRDTFGYDDNYNRTNALFGGPFEPAPSVTDTYAANPVNEYTNIVRNGTLFDVQHDRAGNMTRFPVRPASVDLIDDVEAAARWDAFNCLFDIENPATGKQHYRYDPLRRRIAVLDSETSLQGSRRFVYEGWSDIEERVFDPGATLAGAPSTLERIYVEGPRIDEHLLAAIDRDGDGQLGGANLKNQRDITTDQEYFFLQNRLGNTMALSDADHAVRILEYVRYNAFGAASVLTSIDDDSDGREDSPADLSDNATVDLRRFSEEFANPFTFTGRRFDARAGICQYRNRYYELVSGRFISPDPLTYGDSLNYFGYALNNPQTFTDPNGLRVACASVGVNVVGVLGVGVSFYTTCRDECGNWAIFRSAAARVGIEASIGATVTFMSGGLASMLGGNPGDLNVNVGIFNVGGDANPSTGDVGIHFGAGLGLGGSFGGFTTLLSRSTLVASDLSKGYPCPPATASTPPPATTPPPPPPTPPTPRGPDRSPVSMEELLRRSNEQMRQPAPPPMKNTPPPRGRGRCIIQLADRERATRHAATDRVVGD